MEENDIMYVMLSVRMYCLHCSWNLSSPLERTGIMLDRLHATPQPLIDLNSSEPVRRWESVECTQGK